MSVTAGPVYTLLSKQDFDPLLNAAFRTTNTTPQVQLVLNENRSLRAYPGPGRQDPFALTFRGPLEQALPQAQYQLSALNPQGTEQTFDIFLVPVGLDATGRLYEAVFN